MNAVKFEQSGQVEVPPARVAMTTTLLLLLLACQFPLAADDLGSRLVLGFDSSLLELEDPEPEYSNLELPDFILDSGFQVLHNRRHGVEPASTSAGGHAHFSFTEIRAPPGFS